MLSATFIHFASNLFDIFILYLHVFTDFQVAGPSMSQSRWFVSHYWGTPFAHLVSSASWRCDGKPRWANVR